MINRLKNKVRKQLRLYALRGDTVHCPCCEQSFITFLPGGALEKRPHASCPQCRSLERHRLLWHFLMNKTSLFTQPHRLLHVAPEALFFRRFQEATHIDYVPCAKFGEGYTDVYPTGTVNRDLTALTDADHSFDAILCSHVLEHIPDDAQAMRELYRVLKPEGWAILQVPLDSTLETTYEDFTITAPQVREKAFGQYDHVRVYGNDYPARLARANFRVQPFRTTEVYNRREIFRYGFNKAEDIFLCRK